MGLKMELKDMWKLYAKNNKVYDDLKDGEDWLACPICGLKPVVWGYDHGIHARCLCGVLGIQNTVSYIGPREYYEQNGTLEGYDEAFRNKWNDHVKGIK